VAREPHTLVSTFRVLAMPKTSSHTPTTTANQLHASSAWLNAPNRIIWVLIIATMATADHSA
jgi:hypothetical protein